MPRARQHIDLLAILSTAARPFKAALQKASEQE
jgi:hypothetical protein